MLQIIMSGIALFMISPVCKSLYYAYALYASELSKNATEQQYLLIGVCLCGAMVVVCMIEIAVSLVSGMNISYHLHKNILPMKSPNAVDYLPAILPPSSVVEVR